MLTPAFELSQDEKFVYIYIRTPYIKVGDVEYFIEEHLFKFYVKPYFLRLNFPGKIVENGDESASYDVDKGLFTIRLPKLVPGTHFSDLDLITKLLAPSGKCNISSPGIEVISEGPPCDDEDEDGDFNWEWDQELYDEQKEQQLDVAGKKYGFANQKSGVFYRLKDELKEVIENPNPDELSYAERRIARIAAEDEKFDEEHYLADFFDDERIKENLSYITDKEVSFTDSEKEKLRQLPNREYVFDHKEEISVCYSLVDVMFAFAYDKRATLGESTVESAWTISKLSSTLSWFERFTSLEEVLDACFRRSLSYPLYRHWELSRKVLQDVTDIFELGRRKILKCLLEILMLFNESEPRYLLNELYITDYCIWIQKVKERKVGSLTKRLLETKVRKKSIGWDLKELETAAILVYNEEKDNDNTSDSDSSSCEYSIEEDGSERGKDDSTIGGSTETKREIVEQNAEEFSEEANLCKGELQNSVKDGVHRILDVKNTKPADCIVEENDENSAQGEIRNVEVLPSLLFHKQNIGGKRLVEIISGDDDDNNTDLSSGEKVNSFKSLHSHAVEPDESGANRETNECEKEAVSTSKMGSEQELSCKISRLAVNE